MKKIAFLLILATMFACVPAFPQATYHAYNVATYTTPLGRYIVSGDHVTNLATGREYIVTAAFTSTATLSSIVTSKSYVISPYVGTGAFSTTTTKAGIYIPGAKSTDVYVVSALTAATGTRPGTGELLAYYSMTDSLIVFRLTGTTSGLKFSWVRYPLGQ